MCFDIVMLRDTNEGEVPMIYLGKGNKYMIEELIDSGSFGRVYKVVSTKDQNLKYAAKLEETNGMHSSVIQEFRVYRFMTRQKKQSDKRNYIPKIFYCAKEDDYNVLVMELMGPSLKDLLVTGQNKSSRSCKSKFQLKTVIRLAEQMISALEYIHSRGIIHRDLKPSNFCVGYGQKRNQVYLIDFGLAMKYMVNGKHISYDKVSGMVGNRVYASTTCHRCFQQSRKDDMESLGYVLIDIAKGGLPWKKANGTNMKQKTDYIANQKQNIDTQQLCFGLPSSFRCYLETVKTLQFEEEPNYEFYRNLFRFALVEMELKEFN